LIRDYTVAGSDAAGFVAQKNDVLAVIIRGSDTLEDLIDAAADQAGHFQALEGLFVYALAYARSHNISDVYVSGHSLGGMMVEWFANSNFANLFAQDFDLTLTTFGSPGAALQISPSSYANDIYNFGNTEDPFFEHQAFSIGSTIIPVDQIVNGFVRSGHDITIDLPNVDPHDPLLTNFDFGEHAAFLYERATLALSHSLYGTALLYEPDKYNLIVDTLIDSRSEAPLNLSGRTDDLLILGESASVFVDNDTIVAGSGNDVIESGSGNDILFGGSGSNFLIAGSGNDSLVGGSGVDILRGGPGNDVLNGGEGYDFADYFDATSGVFIDLRTSGAESTSGSGIDTLIGIEAVEGSRFSDDLIGTDASDQLYGEGGNDSLVGLGGPDMFRGGSGNDIIDGGDGEDVMSYQYDAGPVTVDLSLDVYQNTGGSGIDYLTRVEDLVGSAFNDTLSGTGSNNLLTGYDGADQVSGRGGNDTLYLGNGDDIGRGDRGDDYIIAGSGNDSADGGDGNDGILGDAGNDTATGGTGNDVLLGGDDDDLLSGGDGNDTLDGGAGQDVLAGGRGADLFILSAGFEHSTAIDFHRIEDAVLFIGSGFANFADVMSHARQVGTNVEITTLAGDVLQLNRFSLAMLHPSDFLFG
jgi:Ca2+-binding RTX toxin-like protein